MSNFVYSSDEIKINIGVPIPIPGILEDAFNIENFVSVEISQGEVNFDISQGIFRETTITYNPRNISTISITLHHGADENQFMYAIYKAQQFGVIGFPLSIRNKDTSLTSSDSKRRRSYLCPVAVLTKQSDEIFSTQGSNLVYQFKTPYIESVYI